MLSWFLCGVNFCCITLFYFALSFRLQKVKHLRVGKTNPSLYETRNRQIIAHLLTRFLFCFCSGSFGSFLPPEGAHFCRDNGKQLTFTTRGAEQAKLYSRSSIHGYRTVLLNTEDLDACLSYCCKLVWCKHATFGEGKCYGLSCSGDQCSVSNFLVNRIKNKGNQVHGKSRGNQNLAANGKNKCLVNVK